MCKHELTEFVAELTEFAAELRVRLSEFSSPKQYSRNSIPGKKKPYTALLQCRTSLCRKKWGPQRKDFGGGYGFPGFYRAFVSTTGLESFSLRPEKFLQRFLSVVVVYAFIFSVGVPSSGLFFAKYSAEKTKCIDVSQPPSQGNERN